MVGAFPPPVHGMALVNAAVRERLRSARIELLELNLAGFSLDRGLIARLKRSLKVIASLVWLTSTFGLRGGTLYMSVSGGFGQLYDILFVALARLRGMRVFMHHHSFAYLDERKLTTRLLVRLAGPAMHIVLSRDMSERFRRIYPRAQVVLDASNAALLLPNCTAGSRSCRHSLRTLGFLGNISADKGVFIFLDLLEKCLDAQLPIRGKLAGPFLDRRTERLVRERVAELPTVEYVGSRYGNEKVVYYSEIDALVFPTEYLNEAEPLVVHEAMSHGIPVIAYGRGCIPEIVSSDCGKVIDPVEPFVPGALSKITEWLDDSAAFENASSAALQRFAETYTENERRWHALLTDMTGRSGEPAPGGAERREPLSQT